MKNLTLSKWGGLLAATLLLASCAVTQPNIEQGSEQVQLEGVHRVKVGFALAMSRALAWQKLQDYSLAHNYVPGLSRTEIVSENKNNIGAHRRVYDGDDYTEETIIEWTEGEGFLMRLHRGEGPIFPFVFSQFRYQLSDADDGQTQVDLTIYYRLPWGGFGRGLNTLLIERIVASKLIKVGAGMKYFYETGEPATNNDRKRNGSFVSVVD